MSSLLVRLAQGNLWHFVWVAVVLSCLLSLCFSLLIHGQITWDYPFTAGLISLAVASIVVSLIKRLRALEQALAEASLGHAKDRMARDQAEGAWRDSEERFRSFMDHSPAIAWMKDERGRHVYVNHVFEQRFHITEAQWLGKTDFELFPREVALTFQEHDRIILADGTPREFMEVAPDPDGTLRDWWSFKFPFRDRVGQRFVGGVAIDLTDRRQAEAALKASEERLQLALGAAQLGIWDWDIITNTVQWSENVHAVFGLSREAFAGTYEAYVSLIHPQDRERLHQAISHSLEGREEYRIEHRILRPDGSVTWVACRGDVLRNAEGRPVRMLGTVMDVTARKEVELKLSGSEAQLRAILDHSPALIFLKDPSGRYLDCNRQFERTFHLTRETILGKTDAELFAAPQAAAFRANDLLVLEAKRPLQFEEVALHDDGPHTSIVFKFPLVNADGMPYAVGGVATDITDRKRTEAALAKARDQAMEAARLKSEFLATMSHEIRTPMNGVIGMTGLLLDTALTPEQQEYAETVRKCGDHLLTIINDILDFSRIEAGRMTLDSLDFDLRVAIEDTLDVVATQAQAKQLELVGLIDAAVPSAVCGDPGRLRQILTNLLGNAIKFTDRGEVVLRVTVAKDAANHVMVRGEVVDTGIGISPEGQSRLFRTFSQVDSSNTRRYGGTGLGLAVSKRLTELMGGEIGVTSTPGEGSRFWFTVCLAKRSTGVKSEEPLSTLEGRRVCLVGKPGSSQALLEGSLAAWGMQVVCVKDGPDALSLLRAASAESGPFDVLILDSPLSGFEDTGLIPALKTDSVLRRTPVVLVTSFGRRGDAKAAHEAGVAAYLTRPIHQSALRHCLITVLEAAGSPEAGNTGVSRPLITRHSLQEQIPRERPRLLVVDDHELNQIVAVALLERLGCRVDVAGSGYAAVAAVRETSYDLLFMDCEMPDMDGYQTTAVIRQQEGQAHRVPIIALTGHAQQGERERCLAAGMDDYLTKPLQYDRLDELLRRWVTRAAAPDH